MNKYLSSVIGTVWLAATASAAPLEPGWVARIHFAGGDAVAADPHSAPTSLVAIYGCRRAPDISPSSLLRANRSPLP